MGSMRLVGSRLPGLGADGAEGSSDAPPTPRAPEDLALAQRCVEGDPAAQRRLFEEHRHRVHAILFRIFGSNMEMEDLVQDAFMAVYGSLGGFRGDATLGTWVDRITTRVAYRHLRGRKRELTRGARELLDTDAPEDLGDPESESYHREVARRVYVALKRMDPKLRVAYALAVIDGRPQREVAELVGASRVAVKARVWRAQQQMSARAEHDPVLREFVRRTGGQP